MSEKRFMPKRTKSVSLGLQYAKLDTSLTLDSTAQIHFLMVKKEQKNKEYSQRTCMIGNSHTHFRSLPQDFQLVLLDEDYALEQIPSEELHK